MKSKHPVLAAAFVVFVVFLIGWRPDAAAAAAGAIGSTLVTLADGAADFIVSVWT